MLLAAAGVDVAATQIDVHPEQPQDLPAPHDPIAVLVFSFLLWESTTDKALDVIEVTIRFIDIFARKQEYLWRQNADEIANEAIEELNARFKEHGVGYYYSDQQIIRVDSEFVHAQVVKPTLVVLRKKGFASAQAEFLKAHEHYRSR